MDAQYQRDANLGHQDIAVNQFCQVLIVNAHHDQIQKRKYVLSIEYINMIILHSTLNLHDVCETQGLQSV